MNKGLAVLVVCLTCALRRFVSIERNWQSWIRKRRRSPKRKTGRRCVELC